MIVRDEEYLDFSQVPQSRGVPTSIRYAVIIGLIVIFAIGASTCLLSGYGHVWPSDHSMRVQLGPPHSAH
ncbi:MAG: hypothetical protein WB615_13085 [Candidatus Tumulicola sp.]